jgi:hypothetical protein
MYLEKISVPKALSCSLFSLYINVDLLLAQWNPVHSAHMILSLNPMLVTRLHHSSNQTSTNISTYSLVPSKTWEEIWQKINKI